MTDTVASNKALIDALTTRVDALDTAGAATAADQFFLVVCAAMVFLMQAGFALLEAGSIRAKNTSNILLKNVMDACVSALSFWAFGYAFAYGVHNKDSLNNMFIGSKYFFMENFATTDWSTWFFQWAFAATAATIVSGSLAERVTMFGYLIYTIAITAFIYPVGVYWVWSSDGWASAFRSNGDLLFDVGVYDFAGSGVVHMVGGIAGLCGTIIVGPRRGRFTSWKDTLNPRSSSPLRGSSTGHQTLGTLLLWFGWYGFNPGSMLAVSGGAWESVARAAVTTTIAAAAGGVTALLITNIIHFPHVNLSFLLNGILAGLVSITAGCSLVEPYAAFIIGMIGGILYICSSKLLQALHIDDPLDAFPIHGVCGIWGVLAVGAFARKNYVTMVYGISNPEHYGFFYGGGGNLLGAQIVCLLAQISWVVVLCVPLFFILRITRLLRISKATEEIGNDVKKHGGSAFEWLHKVEEIFKRHEEMKSEDGGGEEGSSDNSVKKDDEGFKV